MKHNLVYVWLDYDNCQGYQKDAIIFESQNKMKFDRALYSKDNF